MNLLIWKFFTVQILIILRSVFSSLVILTFMATIITVVAIVFAWSNADLPGWIPSNFSVNEEDLLRWWGYGVITLSILVNVFTKLFNINFQFSFFKRFGLYLFALSTAFILFLITLNTKDLLQGSSILFYLLWYILMIIFLLASLFISNIIQKVRLLQNKKPLIS